MKWEVDSNLVRETLDFLKDDLTVCEYLETVGTLIGLDVLPVDVYNPFNHTDLMESIEDPKKLEQLLEAANQIYNNAKILIMTNEGCMSERALPIQDALALRDSYEIQRIAIETLIPNWKESDKAQDTLIRFEELVMPQLWCLLSITPSVWVELQWLKPSMRERFWWRNRGYGLDRKHLDALVDAALVLSRFPEAKEHFNDLCKVTEGG